MPTYTRSYTSLIFLFWRLGLVDTFTFIKICVNAGFQYGSIVAGIAANNFSNVDKNILIEPLIGIKVGLEYVKIAKTLSQKRTRALVLALFISTSIGTVVSTDLQTNAAVGNAVATKIDYMRSVINRSRGGYIYNIANIAKSISASKKISYLTPKLSYVTSKVSHLSPILASSTFKKMSHLAPKINYLADKVNITPLPLISYTCFNVGLAYFNM